MAFWAMVRGSVLFFYLLLGSRNSSMTSIYHSTILPQVLDKFG